MFNSGPIIHLSEISEWKVLGIFKQIYISPDVYEEINRNKKNLSPLPKFITQKALLAEAKDFAAILCEKFGLELGEATAISLSRQVKLPFFTDDLLARKIAKYLNIEVHGTIGIVLRAFREQQMTKMQAIAALQKLQTESSLYITSNLIRYGIAEIQHYPGEGKR